MDKNDIERVITDYIREMNRASVEGLVSLFTHDGVIMAPDAPTMQGTEQLKAFFTQALSTMKIEAKIHFDEISVNGDHACVRTHSQVNVTVIQAGVTQPEEDRELFLLRKDNGAWKIARYMFNKLPALK